MTEAQIFQLFGLIYFMVGLGLLFEPQYYRKLVKEMVNHKLIMFVFSYIALAVGLEIRMGLNYHCDRMDCLN